MEAVKGAGPEARSELSSKIGATGVHVVGHLYLYPQTGSSIIFQMTVKLLHFRRRRLSMENLLGDGMSPLREVQWREPNTGRRFY